MNNCEHSEALSYVMGLKNSALTHSIFIFRKNATDEKSLIFGCRIDTQKIRPNHNAL